jgi:1,4-alpha-glucan branching enzyme
VPQRRAPAQHRLAQGASDLMAPVPVANRNSDGMRLLAHVVFVYKEDEMDTTTKLKTAEFKLNAPHAKMVNIAGSFNNWNPKKLSAKKDAKGNWTVKINLKPGKYEYKFLVDGNWINDPNCRAYSPNPFGSSNSVIEVR